ncbi:hypothetical protein JCM11641_001549 [Rhodosporidiobolus odoratus]
MTDDMTLPHAMQMPDGHGSASSAQARDLLASLPAELIRSIFLLAWPYPNEAPTAPLSKLLQPLLLKRLYERVLVVSYGQLDKLCRTTTKEHANEAGPSKQDLVFLIRRLSEVKAMAVLGSSRMARRLLQPDIAADRLPSLNSLYLCSDFDGFKDPSHPAIYSSFPPYCQLDSFRLWVERDVLAIKPYNPFPKLCPIISPPMFRLLLCGPLTCSSAAATLLASYTSFLELTLVDLHSKNSLLPLLTAFKEPASVCRLSLSCLYDTYEDNIEETYRTFSDLRELELSIQSLALPSDSCYDVRRALPLTTLTLGIDVGASTEELTALIAPGPRRYPTLEQVELDVVHGEMDTRILEDANGEPWGGVIDDEGYGVYPDWTLPEWTPSFTRDGLKELVRAAEEIGFAVVTDASKALEVDDAFDRELEWQ